MSYVLLVEDQVPAQTKNVARVATLFGITPAQAEKLTVLAHYSAEEALAQLGLNKELAGVPIPRDPEALPLDVIRAIERTEIPAQLDGVCCDLEIPPRPQRPPDPEVGKDLVVLLWHWRNHWSWPEEPAFRLVVCSAYDDHREEIVDFCDVSFSKDQI
jgi:hypothetical protein